MSDINCYHLYSDTRSVSSSWLPLNAYHERAFAEWPQKMILSNKKKHKGIDFVGRFQHLKIRWTIVKTCFEDCALPVKHPSPKNLSWSWHHVQSKKTHPILFNWAFQQVLLVIVIYRYHWVPFLTLKFCFYYFFFFIYFWNVLLIPFNNSHRSIHLLDVSS